MDSQTLIPLFKVFMAPEAIDIVGKTLGSGYLGQGPRVEEFERDAHEFLGLGNGRLLATTSCTHALDLAYHLADIKPGSEVITTALGCAAHATQLLVRGAKIVWADIRPGTGLIDPDSVKECLTANTRAIVAVDWSGRSCDYKSLRSYGIPVIQDAAHSFGSTYVDRGDYVCYSTQAIKHVTTGDGGLLYVAPERAARADLLRWYGLDRGQSSSMRCAQDIFEAGYKYGMNDVAASIGLANLRHAESILSKHRANASTYAERVCDEPRITRPPADRRSSWWLYTMLVDDRESFIDHMKGRGIHTSQVHSRLDSKRCFRSSKANLPGLDRFDERQVSIPVGWWLEDEDVRRIVEAVNEW